MTTTARANPFAPFPTLLRREWLQHHRGYLISMVLPPVLLLLIVAFAPHAHIEPNNPLIMMSVSTAAVTTLVTLVAWGMMAFQLPGLARRDQQDRSIEFWLSLPTSNAANVGATLLMHGLLIPLLAIGIGFVLSQVMALVLVTMVGGAGAWFGLPWAIVAPAALAAVARLVFGVVLGTFWIAPILLVLMVASALLKRWGVAAVAAAVSIAGLVLDKVYGLPLIDDTLSSLTQHAVHSIVHLGYHGDIGQSMDMGEHAENIDVALAALPTWALHDAWMSVKELADPLSVFALAVSVACFVALTRLRRREA